jgi:tight adherence protein C
VTAAVLLGTLVGLGCLGILAGTATPRPTLEAVAATVNGSAASLRSLRPSPPVGDRPWGAVYRPGEALLEWADQAGLTAHPRWAVVQNALDITGQAPERVASSMLLLAGGGLLLPPLLWVGLDAAGLSLPLAVPVVLAMVAVPAGLAMPVASVLRRAGDRRTHFRVVVGTFVDLVVLGLAGGVGIEGALLAASQVSNDWAARRMARTLIRARDSGQSPWEALGRLGQQTGVDELVELAATLQLAGTEGARIRQSLSARSVALRRHQQADAESEANAVTERLFLPGALLLVGFLIFIGYPAISRILGGF